MGKLLSSLPCTFFFNQAIVLEQYQVSHLKITLKNKSRCAVVDVCECCFQKAITAFFLAITEIKTKWTMGSYFSEGEILSLLQ